MLEAKFYDSKGIIPRPGEDQQSYLKRATDTLEALQKFNQDVREKKFGPKGAEYEVVDNPIMRRYGFSELPFPNITLDSDEYHQIFVSLKTKPELISGAINMPVEYSGRELPLTFIDKSRLEVALSETGIDFSEHREDPVRELYESNIDMVLRENKNGFVVGHEMIHGIRRLAGFISGHKGRHFEELVAYSTPLNENTRVKVWEGYFSDSYEKYIKSVGISFFHPFRSIVLLKEYDFLKKQVEYGIAEKFPLPLLVRISYEEFREIAQQFNDGKEIRTAVNEKAESKSKDSWRWQLIAELCEL